MRESRPQQVGYEVLYVCDVALRRRRARRQGRGLGVEGHGDLVRLHEGQHVGENGSVHGEAGGVRGVGHHGEHVLEDVRVVCLVEGLRRLVLLAGHVLQQLEEDVEPGVGDVAHRVLERPDDRVEDELELRGGNVEEGGETVQVDRLQHEEEIGPVFGVLLKVLVDHVQRALEDGVEYLGDL